LKGVPSARILSRASGPACSGPVGWSLSTPTLKSMAALRTDPQSEDDRYHKPNLVVAFAGGRGTADMVLKARSAGPASRHRDRGARMIQHVTPKAAGAGNCRIGTDLCATVTAELPLRNRSVGQRSDAHFSQPVTALQLGVPFGSNQYQISSQTWRGAGYVRRPPACLTGVGDAWPPRASVPY
jgi:hypothetical protein